MDETVNIDSLANRHVTKTAVFRALQLGDMLCAIPAVRAFKERYPDSEITLIGLPWAVNFAERFSRYFSSFIAFPGYTGLVEQPFSPEKFARFLSEVNEREFDLVIQMHGNGSITNRMVDKFNTKLKAGYCPEENRSYGKFFMPYPDGISEVERHLRLMNFLGVPVPNKELEFPVMAEDENGVGKIYAESGLKPGNYVCIHPGARDERRRWSPISFAKVADAVIGCGFKVVLTGTPDETVVVREVAGSMRHTAVNLAGKTELGVLAGLVKNARLLVCNDTGVSHVAAALAVPSIVVFLISDPARWAPLNRRLHEAILPHQAEDIDLVLFNVKQKLLTENLNKKVLRVA